MKLQIEKTLVGYVINEKYLIDFAGDVWYWHGYAGYKEREFPPYVVEIAKIVKWEKENEH